MYIPTTTSVGVISAHIATDEYLLVAGAVPVYVSGKVDDGCKLNVPEAVVYVPALGADVVPLSVTIAKVRLSPTKCKSIGAPSTWLDHDFPLDPMTCDCANSSSICCACV